MNFIEYRRHVKAFGIRFIIVVNSKAGKFSFIPLLISIGSGKLKLSFICLKNQKYFYLFNHFFSLLGIGLLGNLKKFNIFKKFTNKLI